MQGISPSLILGILIAYFLSLIFISYLTSRGSDNEDFFIGGRKSPWFVVAFGMIGASLSGVTFISVPGWVEESQFSYMQMVFGYFFGYVVIAFILMPMYYKLRLTSIYGYLERRFGFYSYKTGAGYFLLSRTIGSAFRLFLVAIVLQKFLMNSFGIPFWATILITIALIWVYTYQGGIKTIIWTDILQTTCMLIALIATIMVIGNSIGIQTGDLVGAIRETDYSRMWFFSGGWDDSRNFFKQFLSGMFIAIVMTGLDQDMMQKNLSCKNIRDAQKNMMTFSVILMFANLLFLCMGALLYMYSAHNGIEMPFRMVMGEARPASDLLYPTIALEYLNPAIGITFIVGLIAAAYSSADSALTALTTSFCIDVLNFEKGSIAEERKKRTRFIVHIGFSLLLFFVIMLFWYINNDAVIAGLFKAAGYTYGPLLGLYAFGFYIDRQVRDRWVPVICVLSPVLTFLIDNYSEQILWGYKFGFEILILNGLITFAGIAIASSKITIGEQMLLTRRKGTHNEKDH